MTFREGRCGEGTAPLGWVAEDGSFTGGWNQGRTPSLIRKFCVLGAIDCVGTAMKTLRFVHHGDVK